MIKPHTTSSESFKSFCSEMQGHYENWSGNQNELFTLSVKPNSDQSVEDYLEAIEFDAHKLAESDFGLLEIWFHDELNLKFSLDSVLARQDIFINAIFQSPEAAWIPTEVETSVFLFISRSKRKYQFVCSLAPDDFNGFLELDYFCNYFFEPESIADVIKPIKYDFSDVSSKSYSDEGSFFEFSEFRGFEYSWKHRTAKNLLKEFCLETSEYEIKELKQFEPHINFDIEPPLLPENSPLPSVEVVCDHQIEVAFPYGFFIDIDLRKIISPDSNRELSAKYIHWFLQSELGRSMLELKAYEFKIFFHQLLPPSADQSEPVFPKGLVHLEKPCRDLIEQLIILTPTAKSQERVVSYAKKLQEIKGSLRVIEKQIYSLKNAESDKILEQLEGLHGEIIKSSSNQLKKLLDLEESQTFEFKASIRTPYPDYPPVESDERGNPLHRLGSQTFTSKKQMHKFLERIILKAIVSLLNSKGGRLVIGVHEKDNIKNIVGIEREGFDSDEKYERYIADLISNTFGSLVATEFVSTEILKTEDKKMSVCVIHCKPFDSKDCLFLDNHVYVRQGPQTKELVGEHLMKFIQHRQENISRQD